MSVWLAVPVLWAVLAAAFAVVWAVRRRRGPLDTGASTAFIGSALGLLLSLVLFFVMGHHGEAQTSARAEATANSTLFSSMALLPDRYSNPAQHAVICLMESIAEDEWPEMRAGDFNGSPLTRQYTAALYGAISTLPKADPAVQPYFVGLWNRMLDRAAARDARLAQGPPRVPMPVWAVIFTAVFVLVVLIGLQERVTGRAPWVGVGAALAVVLTMVVGVIAVLDNPYAPIAPVQPDAMRNSLERMRSGQPANSPVIAPCRPPAQS